MFAQEGHCSPENQSSIERSVSACVARVTPGDWSFRGRGSKLPWHKAQASLRTPKGTPLECARLLPIID
jgi:hypothetical protein